MVTLPKTTRVRPLVRLAYRIWPQSSSGQSSGGWTAWTPLPMAQRVGARSAINGFLVDGWSRYCLPMIGEATFRYRTGTINGITYSGSDSQGNPVPPDLKRAEIRIQIAVPPAFGVVGEALQSFAPAWFTAWAGTVESVETMGTSGEIVYHCFDGFYRTKRWQMMEHYFYYSDGLGGTVNTVSRGHPGYNVGVEGFYCRVQGNRDPSPVPSSSDPWQDRPQNIVNRYYAHTWPSNAFGAGTEAAKWTDKQAIEHALHSSRGKGEPWLELRGSAPDQHELALLSGTSAWPVIEGMRCWDFVAGVCDRRRGRGLVFYDWEDDSADPLGPLDQCLRVRSPFASNLTYTPPGSSPIEIKGAIDCGTARVIDHSGDHRLVPGSVKLGDPMQHRFDYVESMGENIEALVTLAGRDGSLAGRWSEDDAATFPTLTARQRSTSRWDPVFQRFGLPTAWQFFAKNGNNGDGAPAQMGRCDYTCADDGTVGVPTGSPASALVTTILSDLPLYEAWNYAPATPARYDLGSDFTAPPRRPIMALVRTNGNNFLDLCRIGGFSLQVDPAYGLYLKAGQYQADTVGGRFFAEPPGTGIVGYAADWRDLVFTVGLRLPNRVRMASGQASSPRRLFIRHPGLHLWVAHPGAIWDLDRSSATIAEAPAKRAAAGTATPPGLLRDDRAALAQLHALACVWYLQDHRTAAWSIRDCTALPSYTDEDGAVIVNPKLGDFAISLSYTDVARATATAAVGTPITGFVYDNVRCMSSLSTDWQDLDFVSR